MMSAANGSLTRDEFNLLRSLVEQECGIALGEDKMYLMESRLAGLLVESGCTTYGEFYEKVKSNTLPNIKSRLIDAVTTNETLWFRDEAPFRALKELVFPALFEEIKQQKRHQIRIWSAACSTGQEPYSIAMTFLETPGSEAHKHRLQIVATDICSSALFVAKNARYDNIAMSRGMPEALKARYFQEQGRVHVLKDDVKSLVRFQPFNLQQPFDALGRFDVIFMRNVAIYFSAAFKTDLFRRVHGALNPNGYLFLGTSEHLQAYNRDFALRDYGRCLFYQRQ